MRASRCSTTRPSALTLTLTLTPTPTLTPTLTLTLTLTRCAVAKWPDVRKRFEAEMLPLSDVSNVKSALVVADIQVLLHEP
mgnify:FL=1